MFEERKQLIIVNFCLFFFFYLYHIQYSHTTHTIGSLLSCVWSPIDDKTNAIDLSVANVDRKISIWICQCVQCFYANFFLFTIDRQRGWLSPEHSKFHNL